MIVAFCNIYFGLVAICDRFFFSTLGMSIV